MTMRIHGDKIEFPDGTEQFTASSGGGGEAQPPVAFNYEMSANQVIDKLERVAVNFNTKVIDTDNAFDVSNNCYVVPKSGLYQLNSTLRLQSLNPSNLVYAVSTITVNGDTVVKTNDDFSGNYSYAHSAVNGIVVRLEKGQKVVVNAQGHTTTAEPNDVITVNSAYGSFSGHMISSITEGEVKEKEAVVFRGGISARQSVTSDTYTKVNLDTASTDTDNALVDGKFQPSVAGWYQVNGAVADTGTEPRSVHTVCRIYKNGEKYTEGSSIYGATISSYLSNVSDVIYLDPNSKWTDSDGNEQVGDYLELYGYVSSSTGTCTFSSSDSQTFLSAHLITGQSSGGGSGGGGSYTPEKMVWEEYPRGYDPVTERNIDVTYTNDTDVPRYVQMYIATDGLENVEFQIDGKSFGYLGNSDNDSISNQTPLFVVPSGSTYKLARGAGSTDIVNWHEARMPVAVGTGDSVWTEEDGKAKYDGDIEVNGVTVGTGEVELQGNLFTFGDKVVHQNLPTTATESNLYLEPSDGRLYRSTYSIDQAPEVTLQGNLVTYGERVAHLNLPTTTTPSNIYLEPTNGRLYRSTTTSYSAEEVDNKLAIKDKLIEKLSARLDELEKKVK